jgi:hypothetical protein
MDADHDRSDEQDVDPIREECALLVMDLLCHDPADDEDAAEEVTTAFNDLPEGSATSDRLASMGLAIADVIRRSAGRGKTVKVDRFEQHVDDRFDGWKGFVATYGSAVAKVYEEAFRAALVVSAGGAIRDELDRLRGEVTEWRNRAAERDADCEHDAVERAEKAEAGLVPSITWEEPNGSNNRCWVARTILGTYSVAFDDGWHASLEDGMPWEWEPENDPRTYSGPSAAQKACDDHHRGEILKAIHGRPAEASRSPT